ncbi:MAG: tetratricopeptide repeat protein [Haloechinothrix sp.]
MRNKTLVAAVLLTAAVLIYLVLLAGRAVALLSTGDTIPVLLGVGVLLLPLLGLWIVVTTWRSGLRIARLAAKLAAEDGLPDVSSLPRRPSGRVDRAAADEWFAERRAEVEADPEDWRTWYRLAHAYDIAGDRRRAREIMRQAIELEQRD